MTHYLKIFPCNTVNKPAVQSFKHFDGYKIYKLKDIMHQPDLHNCASDSMVALITIPCDARVQFLEYGCIVNKIKINSCIPLEEWKLWDDYNFCVDAVKENGYLIRYIKNPKYELYELAVRSRPLALRYLPNPSVEMCFTAVRACPEALKYVDRQTYDLCLLAVEKDGTVLKYVQNQTDELCRIAINSRPDAYQYVKNKTWRLWTLSTCLSITRMTPGC